MLLLIVLDKVEKEKDEFRDSNSQPKCFINDLKVSMSAMKEVLISWVATERGLLKLNAESHPLNGGIKMQIAPSTLQSVCS